MSKNKQGRKAAIATTTASSQQVAATAQGVAPPAGAAGTTAQAATVLHLEVKTGLKYRGAREKWYEVLVQHNGKPASAYLLHCKEQPPSVPKSGVPEAPQGWLAWFTRQGVAKLVPAGQ